MTMMRQEIGTLLILGLIKFLVSQFRQLFLESSFPYNASLSKLLFVYQGVKSGKDDALHLNIYSAVINSIRIFFINSNNLILEFQI